MIETNSYKSYIKSPYKSIKHSTYFDSYDHFFGKYRDKEITFVEIGVFGGGSLFMWRDFFGPKARIIGIDLNPNAKKWEEHGFEIFIGSQSDINFWEKFKSQVGNVDVVLDDGGHTYDQQIITTECLLEVIDDGGVIVVEDTHTSYMDGFGPKKYSFIEYIKKKIDDINYRFGEFYRKDSENRFWSIEIVESMVALKVNKKASLLESIETSNQGEDDLAKDFRYHDDRAIKIFDIFVEKISFLKKISFIRYLGIKIRLLIADRYGFSIYEFLRNNKNKTKKFFK